MAAPQSRRQRRCRRRASLKVEGSSYPNWAGTEQKRTILSFAGDDLTWSVAASAGRTGEVGWKRVK